MRGVAPKLAGAVAGCIGEGRKPETGWCRCWCVDEGVSPETGYVRLLAPGEITLCAGRAVAAANTGSARILLVDDEQSVQTLLTYPLRKEGYEVVTAHDGREALDRFAEQRFDLVVLDIMLPKLDGIEVCRRMRSRSQVPIIMLTAKDDEIDKVVGLEMGADDYITKPFSVREFRSRVRAALRRAEMIGGRPGGEEPIAAGDLRIDFERRVVTARRKRAQLTYVEFEILAALARSPGRVQTREMLLEQVWGDSAYRDPRTIDVHIRHLREKIERNPRSPEDLFTVRGVGYRFRDKDE